MEISSTQRWALIIAAGIFSTTLAQPEALDLPLRRLLKADLHLDRQEMAAFFAAAALPWYFKFVVGVVVDSVPFFGTYRRHYLISSALAAAVMWLVVGMVPRSYLPLLFAVAMTNAMLVVASVVVGGLLVQAGQDLSAVGQLVRIRVFVEGACLVIAGPLAGLLAGIAFETATMAGALIAGSVAPIALLLLQEQPSQKHRGAAVIEALRKLRELLFSRSVLTFALFLFLVGSPQNLSSSLYYFQTNELKLTDEIIGYINLAGGVGAILATIVYGLSRLQLSLRSFLTIGIICSAVGVFSYRFYDSLEAAVAIEGFRVFFTTFGVMAMMEAVIWATPKTAAAMGFAFFVSVWNLGASLGDNVSAAMIQKWSISFHDVPVLFAVLTILCLCFLPFLPSSLLTHRAGPGWDTR